MTAAGETVPGRRLNPFVLPSSTTSRFLILIAATVAGCLYLNGFLVTLWRELAHLPEHARHAECLSALRSGVRSIEPILLLDRYGKCAAGVATMSSLLVIASLAVPVAFALLLYALHPLRALRYDPLATVGDGDAHADLVRRFGVIAEQELPGRNIRMLVDSGRPGITGRAFGLPRRHVVALSMGLVIAHSTKPAAVEAVLRHELAHIRNRDVGIAHITVAIWWSFLLTACVPMVAAMAIGRPAELPAWCARLSVLVLVLWLARTAVLRAREHHADVRAGDTAERQDAMARAIETDGPTWWSRGPLRHFGNHPGKRYRLAVLEDPGRLLRLDQWEMATAGLLAGLGFAPVYTVYSYLDSEAVLDLRFFVPGVMFGLLVSGIVVVAVWRAGIERPTERGSGAALWWAATSFTLGVVAGQFVTRVSSEQWIWTIAFANPLLGLTYCLVLLLIVRVFLGWAKACFSAWTAVSVRPRTIALATVALSGLVVGPWLGFWFHGITVIALAGSTWDLLAVTLVTMARYSPLVLTIALACAYLLAAGTRGRSVPGRSLRLHLDGGAPVLLQRSYVRVARAAAPAAIACVAVAVSGFALHPMLTEGSRHKETGQFLAAVYVTMGVAVGLLVLAALVIGVMIGGRGMGGWSMAHAGTVLLAAAVPMSLVILGHVAVAECGWERAGACLGQGAPLPLTIGNYATLTYAYAVYPGLVLAGCGSLMRARRHRAAPEPRRGALRVVAAVVTVVVTLALAAGGYGILRNWQLTVGASPYARMTWQKSVIDAANRPIEPGTVPGLDSCRYALGVFASPELGDVLNVDQRYYVLAATLINRVASSDDPVLQETAKAGFVWLGRGRADMVTKVVDRLLHYCALVRGEHQANAGAS